MNPSLLIEIIHIKKTRMDHLKCGNMNNAKEKSIVIKESLTILLKESACKWQNDEKSRIKVLF